MGMKLTATLTALSGFAAIAASDAQAGPRHWFYGQYDQYDNQAYYDDGGYGPEYEAYANPPRRYSRQELERFRRWAHRQNQLARERRAWRRAANRARRQRLYDIWTREGGEWRGQAYYRDQPPRRQVKIKQRKKFKLAYVPIPRAKPYHLLAKRQGPARPASVQPSQNRQITITSLPPVSPPAANVKVKLAQEAKPSRVSAKSQVTAPATIPVKITTSTKPVKLAPVKAARPVKVAAVEVKRLKPVTKVETTKNVLAAKIAEAKKRGKPLLRKPVTIDVASNRKSKNPVSCTRAKSIVSDFGFGNVRAITCRGKIYDFGATRDGKPYSVRVSALSGELKGVTKLK